MSFSKRLAGAVLNPVASRPRVLIGTLLVVTGAGHFAAWTRTAGAALLTAAAAGDTTRALNTLASYAAEHPAYLVAVLAGVLVAASRR